MKIAKFFKAKKVSDRCRQHQEDYKNLLGLKKEFEEALESGAKNRNLEETKRVKTDLDNVLRKLELDLKFKVWKTIELGTGLKNADDFIQALEDGGCEITDSIKFIMKQPGFTVLSEKTEIDLVIVSVAELGFSKGATLEEIYKRAKEMGLELCLPEVGPQLRLQYKDQPIHEWLRVAMDTIKDSDGDPHVFHVVCGAGGPWLDALYDDPGDVRDADDRWVFVRRKL